MAVKKAIKSTTTKQSTRPKKSPIKTKKDTMVKTKGTLKKKKPKALSFTDDDVDIKDPLEAIRLRYDMYIGSKDPVTHLCEELIDNSIDEAMNNFCDTIYCTVDEKKNSFSIQDNGRGLPLGINKEKKISTIEVLYTINHAGGKFGKNVVKSSGGKNGIGLKTVNACSKRLEVVSERDGQRGTIVFSGGKVIQPLTVEDKTKNVKKHGTYNYFIPDPEVFPEEDIRINPEILRERLKWKCYLNPNLTIHFKLNKDKEEVFHNENGIVDYLVNTVKNPIFNMENIFIRDEDDDGNQYNVALIWNNETDERILSFVNSLSTTRGTHESGFKTGLTRAINKFITDKSLLTKKDKDLVIKGEDTRRGLVCIISLTHDNPKYDGQTKSNLENTSVHGIMNKITYAHMLEWMEANEQLARKICERVISFSRATNNANKQMKNIVKLGSNASALSITHKLKDCESNDSDIVEIFIIEGDSAGTTAENARDSKYQCILPFKGKIKNTYNLSSDTLIANAELNEFLKVEFGTNNLKEIRKNLQLMVEGDSPEPGFYIKSKKIIVMTDADTDGSHIQNLFLAFIYYHLPEMLDLGYIYIVKSPFYRVLIGKHYQYFMNDTEYSAFISKIISQNVKVHNEKWNVQKIMSRSERYKDEYERIIHKFGIHPDVLDWIIRTQGTEEVDISLIEDNGLDWVQSDDFASLDIVGLYGNIWHSFELFEVIEEIEIELLNIYPFKELLLELDGEVYEYSIYDGINLMQSFFKYKRNRIKGKPMPPMLVTA